MYYGNLYCNILQCKKNVKRGKAPPPNKKGRGMNTAAPPPIFAPDVCVSL